MESGQFAWDTLGVVLKALRGIPLVPGMTAIDCAACLHAITDPESPVLVDGCFFHPAHAPSAEAGAAGAL